MKNRNILFLIALMSLSSCGQTSSGSFPSNSSNPPSDVEISNTAYGNLVKYSQVSNPSNDIEIKVIRDKTSSTRGSNVVYEGKNSLDVASFKTGDIVRIKSDYQFIKVKVLNVFDEVILFSPEGEFIFEIPSSTAYSNDAFKSSTIICSVCDASDLKQDRNVALNPYDFMYKSEINNQTSSSLPLESVAVENNEVVTYPHAYANRVTRNEQNFFARNAIDGYVQNDGHGNYPYQSWGYDQKDDAEFIVYFGRKVKLTSLSFVLRADYSGTKEHDTHWESLDVEFSNGTSQKVSLSKSNEKQIVKLNEVETSYVRLKNIKSKENINSQMYAALTELEAIGYDDVTKNNVAVKRYVTPTFGGNNKNDYYTDELKSEDIYDTMKMVNNWFMKNDGVIKIPTYNGNIETLYVNSNDWRDSVYYSGLLEYFLTTGDENAYHYLSGVAEQFNYLVNDDYRTPHGDHYQIGELYLQLNDLYGNQDFKIKSAVDNAKYNIARDPNDSSTVTSTNSYATDSKRDWSHMAFWWCDALYMAMNTYTLLSRQTGERKYVDACFEGYKHWKNELYNKEYDLWHRDSTQFKVYTNLTDENGNKVPTFWARGNAWVHAALAKQMLYLEKDKYPEIYDQYEKDFIEISESISKYQRDDGTWNASIVDDTYYGGRETTGTSGFMYAFCVGIELGILDYDTYFPIVKKAYQGLLNNCMLKDSSGNLTGQLGYMQTVGYQPQNYNSESYSKEITNEFGMGLFLMGASSLMRICKDYESPEIVMPRDPQSVVKTVIDPFFEENSEYYIGNFTVTASGYQDTTSGYNPPQGLFDGDYTGTDGKRWAVEGFPNKVWAKVDFNETLNLNKVALAPNSQRDYKYIIEVSMDGTNWTEVVDRSNNTESASLLFDTFEPIDCKFMKLTLEGAHSYTGKWYNINELFIFKTK